MLMELFYLLSFILTDSLCEKKLGKQDTLFSQPYNNKNLICLIWHPNPFPCNYYSLSHVLRFLSLCRSHILSLSPFLYPLSRILQKQNEELHHSLLQTTMRMEGMRVEFKTNHQQLEVDLQRTQLELENLKDKFKRSTLLN